MIVEMNFINLMFAIIVNLLRKTQGRDKLTKFLIYLFKIIDSLKTWYRGRPTFRYSRIAQHFQKARQLMRLGKFITEYYYVLKIINDTTAKDEFGRLFQVILHAIFSFYWVLDNIALATSFGLIQARQFEITQTAMTIKFIGMVAAALFNLRSWIRLHHSQLKARKALRYLKGQQNLQTSNQLRNLIRKQWKMFLLILKIIADIFPTVAKSIIAKRLLKIQIPRIVQAIGGLVNSCVSCMITTL